MIRSVIIDDEVNNISNLKALLNKYCPLVALVGSALNAEEGKKLVENLEPDLIFLDIQMPGKNGFELLQSLPNCNFEVIFVTAYDQYGIQAVKFAAIDYLLKPINIEELKMAVTKVSQRNSLKKQNVQLEKLIELLQFPKQQEGHRMALPTSKEIRYINTQDIVRCQSSNSYTAFHFTDGEKLIISKPLYEYEKLLSGYGFIRCHQSHLVNKKFIKSWIKEDGGYLLLTDQTMIPVSKQRADIIKYMLTS